MKKKLLIVFAIVLILILTLIIFILFNNKRNIREITSLSDDNILATEKIESVNEVDKEILVDSNNIEDETYETNNKTVINSKTNTEKTNTTTNTSSKINSNTSKTMSTKKTTNNSSNSNSNSNTSKVEKKQTNENNTDNKSKEKEITEVYKVNNTMIKKMKQTINNNKSENMIEFGYDIVVDSSIVTKTNYFTYSDVRLISKLTDRFGTIRIYARDLYVNGGYAHTECFIY